MSSFLKFQVQFHTKINESIRIIGNLKDLGEWNISKGLLLQTNPSIYPDWTHDTFIEIPLGTLVEFKCVKFEGDRLLRWESLPMDVNRKYKTQYFKALLFMKEDQVHLIERPFQKYNGNHDCDILDTTNAKKIQEKFIIFDPLRKADGLSSSSDNSSLDFFRRQSRLSDDLRVISDELEAINEKLLDQTHGDPQQQTNVAATAAAATDCINERKGSNEGKYEKEHKIEGKAKQKGIHFTTSSLRQIEGKVPKHLKNIFLLFNRTQKERATQKGGKNRTFRRIVDFKDLSFLNQMNTSSVMQNSSNGGVGGNQNGSRNDESGNISTDEKFSYLKNSESKVKSMPLMKVQEHEKTEKTLIIVSYDLPIQVKLKKRKMNNNNNNNNNIARISAGISSSSASSSIGGGSMENYYDFVSTIDPLVISLYSNLVNAKLNLIWIGVCNIFVESSAEQEELREFMLHTYKCYPIFYNETTNSLFARQFCSKFTYSAAQSSLDSETFYEEEESWLVYKRINKDVATLLRKLVNDVSPVFAILVYDFHFFLVPSYYSTQKKHAMQSSVQQIDSKAKVTFSYFMNRKFPAVALLESLPQADIIMHSLFFSDIMSFSTYEVAEPFITFAQKMGCTLLHKSGGKIVLQCNGREIFIRIEHPGINIVKLQNMKESIHAECEKRLSTLDGSNKHLIIGVDSISKNSGFEMKFRAFEKFLKREKLQKSVSEYKLKQIVFFSTDSEFASLQEQQDYLHEVKALARSINQSQSFYDSAIEIIEGESLSVEEYYSYLTLSECFFATTLQATRHFHYMEYLFLRKDGYLILSNCLSQVSQFNAVHITNPQDQLRIVANLVKIFADLNRISKINQELKHLQLQAQTKQILSPATLISQKSEEKQSTDGSDKQDRSKMLLVPSIKGIGVGVNSPSKDRSGQNFGNIGMNYMTSMSTIPGAALTNTTIAGSGNSGSEIQSSSSGKMLSIGGLSSGADRSRINITEKNSTSDQAQREFDYNYLIKFCSSQKWINHLIGDIVKRQSIFKDTCVFSSTEHRQVVINKEQNSIHSEDISKIYERPASQYFQINLQNLIYKTKNAKNAIFVFGFSSVFFEHPANLLSEPNANVKLFAQIKELATKPNVTIYIISGKSPELLAKYFENIENIIIFSHNGLRVQIIGQDAESVFLTKQCDPTFWKMCIASRMDNFVQKTAGSYIIESEISTSWHFENVEREFACAQKDELVRQLLSIVESMPGNEIFEGYDFIQVRPSSLNKGTMTKIAIQNSFLEKNHKVDMLVVVGGRKTTDEEMLKSVRELIFEEKVSYIDHNAPLILGSISSQLGALYCNHQFENNQELAVLLELMNGNKQLLKADQIFAGSSPMFQHQQLTEEQQQQRMISIPSEHPHLIRQGTLEQYPDQMQDQFLFKSGDNEAAATTVAAAGESADAEGLEHLPQLATLQFSNSMQPQAEELLSKRNQIKAFDIKIPFVNQTHSLNFISKQML